MQQRIHLTDQVFYLGLFLMLSAATLSAAGWLASGNIVLAFTVVGCIMALTARIWGSRLRRALRRRDALADLAGHPLTLFHDPRFASRRTSAL